MCRPVALGGRRCPSHSDPARIAAYNAIRRERYAASKGKQPETSHVGEKVSPAVPESYFNHPLRNAEVNGKSGDDLFHAKGASGEQKALNITTTENEGALVDINYFAEKTIRGVINYTNLDENSYKEFGFGEVVVKRDDGDETYDRSATHAFDQQMMDKLSAKELENMTDPEKAALRFFSSENYEWVNKALYGDKHALEDEEASYSGPYLTPGKQDLDFYHYSDEVARHSSVLKEITGHIDSAMEKGPKQQRIVYRGMSMYNDAFQSGGLDTEEAVQKWLDNNVSLGQEIVFDGYQSSTPNWRTAAQTYSGHGGVVYEILTPEGINITNVSQYEEEKEVLLPRNSRYMIVGVHRNVPGPYGDEKINVVQMVAINSKGAVLDGTNADTPPPINY